MQASWPELRNRVILKMTRWVNDAVIASGIIKSPLTRSCRESLHRLIWYHCAWRFEVYTGRRSKSREFLLHGYLLRRRSTLSAEEQELARELALHEKQLLSDMPINPESVIEQVAPACEELLACKVRLREVIRRLVGAELVRVGISWQCLKSHQQATLTPDKRRGKRNEA